MTDINTKTMIFKLNIYWDWKRVRARKEFEPEKSSGRKQIQAENEFRLEKNWDVEDFRPEKNSSQKRIRTGKIFGPGQAYDG